jgi:methylthioribose-1-phosphate isomerase
MIAPIKWLGNRLRILDQTGLPQQVSYLELDSYLDIASAIVELKIRGAPAIGIAGAYAIVLGALKIEMRSKSYFSAKFNEIINTISSTRPTARNLFRVIECMQKVVVECGDISQIRHALLDEAVRIEAEEMRATREICRIGAKLIADQAVILTHCNTGPLATTGYGTALGIIMSAFKQGKQLRVMATETRPLLQGSRLTCWELTRENIPTVLITDSMAGYYMTQGKIDVVIVGADRIAGNGDTANKIGTYSLAVLAREHRIPFYVAAPTTTIDSSINYGNEIPIEQRSVDEVTHFRGLSIAPMGCSALNPAFDITPYKFITAIVTERGIIKEPYREGFDQIRV